MNSITILYFELHPLILMIGMLMIVLFIVVQWRRGQTFARLLCLFLFSSYLLVFLDVMFLAVRTPPEWPGNITLQQELFTLSHVNLIPFYFGNLFLVRWNIVFWELVGNILLTIPFGFGLPLLFKLTTKKILWIAALTGFTLECAQLVILLLGLVNGSRGYSVDINDLLLNASGVLLGYGLYRLVSNVPLIQKLHQDSPSLSETSRDAAFR